MTWPRGVREAGLGMVVAGAVLALLIVLHSPLIRGLETASFDLRYRLRGVRPPGPQVAAILVDDASLNALGRWPLPRRLFAKAVEVLSRDGAKVIAFDLLFAEPEEPVPSDVRAAARSAVAHARAGSPLHRALQKLAGDDPDGDFAAAIKRSGRVLLPVALTFTGKPTPEPDDLATSGYQRFERSPKQPLFPLQPVGGVFPIARLAKAAAGLGHVSIAFDRDGEPRYDYLALPYGGDFIPSLPVRAAAAYLGVPWKNVGLALGAGVQIGPLWVPTDAAMRLLVDYRGPSGTIPTRSFADLIEGRIPPSALRGRIVLIGASFVGDSDAYPAPFGPTYLSGTERLATIIDTILNRRFIAESPPPWPLVTPALVLLLALAGGIAGALLPTRLTILAAAVPLAAWFGGAQLAFLHGLWLPLVAPLIALATATAAVLLFRYRIVDASDRAIKAAFRHYLAPEMVNVLAAHPERLRLGGETRRMTLLFCDVRGFTSISEGFKDDPEGLPRLLNRFLTPMTDLILAHHGTIDKYMGDCIMAFWNAPLDDLDHADHACEVALAMIAALEHVNRELRTEAEAANRPFAPLRVGIGLNTGDCVVGNMGSDQRFDYSVLGDAVNLASRLEGQSKTYNLDIIIGEETRRAAPSWAALELDLIEVKGKREAVQIYGLLGDAALAQSSGFQSLAVAHRRMLACYRRRDWAGALAALGECRGRDPRLDGLYDRYEERVGHFRTNPPGPDWNGVFVALTK